MEAVVKIEKMENDDGWVFFSIGQGRFWNFDPENFCFHFFSSGVSENEPDAKKANVEKEYGVFLNEANEDEWVVVRIVSLFLWFDFLSNHQLTHLVGCQFISLRFFYRRSYLRITFVPALDLKTNRGNPDKETQKNYFEDVDSEVYVKFKDWHSKMASKAVRLKAKVVAGEMPEQIPVPFWVIHKMSDHERRTHLQVSDIERFKLECTEMKRLMRKYKHVWTFPDKIPDFGDDDNR